MWGEGLGGRGREGGLGVKRGIPVGLCECLVRGQGSQEGKQGGERAWVVEARRVGSGSRGESLEGSMVVYRDVMTSRHDRS